jgi:predicted short-subunit dehydrogenase-like oxidoreductase (DUF2520 family)
MGRRLRVVVVGRGRAGGSLAAALRAAAVDVAVVRARPLLRRRRRRVVDADVVFVAVPDAAIADVAACLDTDGLVLHLAGALGCAALVGHPRRGVFHLLASLDGRRPPPRGCLCAWDVAGDDEQGGAVVVQRLAKRLGLFACRVRDADRARYHAGAVIAGNLATALLHLGAQQLVAAGVDVDVARVGLARLLATTAARAERAPLPQALTGPVARGDVDTVAGHLAALPAGAARDAYALLTRVLVNDVRPVGAVGRSFPAVVVEPTHTAAARRPRARAPRA